MCNLHLQDEDLIFCSLADLPTILFQELFTCVHFHCSSVLGPEYLTELLPEKKDLQQYINTDVKGVP